MKSFAVRAMIAAILLPAVYASAEAQQPASKAGEEYQIRRSYKTSEQGSDGSSSSSSGHDTLLERVISVRDAGAELEYDLAKDAKPEDRARSWQFPARIFRPVEAPMRLLNSAELEARLERWLKVAGWDRQVCGRWVFTWNAFRIECDPQSVIKTIEAVDLTSADVRAGASYQDKDARGPGTLARKVGAGDGASFVAVMEVDPEQVRRARAESDVAIGEIMRKPVTVEAALRERAKESVSGTISVTFDTDSSGRVVRRTKVTKLETKGPDGISETATRTETVERRLVSSPTEGG